MSNYPQSIKDLRSAIVEIDHKFSLCLLEAKEDPNTAYLLFSQWLHLQKRFGDFSISLSALFSARSAKIIFTEERKTFKLNEK